ncbi:glycohydrolase toxin TNT-related protein [Streptomyces griseoluteus]|uniref:glycohydrolase toxin TNT-related protein n=1 Tax=Streptomyces griseoluteus TaxID=29306 RepID=UPI0036786FB3
MAKDVTVCAGPQAPAFEQPGTGTQYVTSSSFCPSIPRTNVADLVNNGTPRTAEDWNATGRARATNSSPRGGGPLQDTGRLPARSPDRT